MGKEDEVYGCRQQANLFVVDPARTDIVEGCCGLVSGGIGHEGRQQHGVQFGGIDGALRPGSCRETASVEAGARADVGDDQTRGNGQQIQYFVRVFVASTLVGSGGADFGLRCQGESRVVCENHLHEAVVGLVALPLPASLPDPGRGQQDQDGQD